MASSAILRRWFSRGGSVGILRISVEGASHNSCCSRESTADRKMSTAASGVRSPEPPSAPWLMLPPCINGGGSLAYKFHRLAENDEFSCENKLGGGDQYLPANIDIDIVKDVDFAGSSQGWLALFNRRNYDLHLSNPITDRHIKLPPLPQPRTTASGPGVAERVILSSSPEEEGCLAFATVGGGGAALCSPRRGNKWSFLSGVDREYEDLVYSSTHKRLFCVSYGSAILESWETSDESEGPRLDWAIQDKKELDFREENKRLYRWPRRCLLKRLCGQVKYLVCDETATATLYLVVRHVNPRAGPYGGLVDKISISEFSGRQYVRTPYKTIDFDVYRIDWKRGEMTHMENSLEGLAMFVGTNHSSAIPAAEVAGVKPDSVYFTDEIRLAGPTRSARTLYGGHDNGIFDYKNKDFHRCCAFYPIEFNQIRKVLPPPLWWFTPTTTPITKLN